MPRGSIYSTAGLRATPLCEDGLVYHVWIVTSRDLEPIQLSASFIDEQDALGAASGTLTSMGAAVLAARNAYRNGSLTLLVYDPTGLLPFSAFVEGAVLSENGRSLPPNETTETIVTRLLEGAEVH